MVGVLQWCSATPVNQLNSFIYAVVNNESCKLRHSSVMLKIFPMLSLIVQNDGFSYFLWATIHHTAFTRWLKTRMKPISGLIEQGLTSLSVELFT